MEIGLKSSIERLGSASHMERPPIFGEPITNLLNLGPWMCFSASINPLTNRQHFIYFLGRRLYDFQQFRVSSGPTKWVKPIGLAELGFR